MSVAISASVQANPTNRFLTFLHDAAVDMASKEPTCVLPPVPGLAPPVLLVVFDPPVFFAPEPPALTEPPVPADLLVEPPVDNEL